MNRRLNPAANHDTRNQIEAAHYSAKASSDYNQPALFDDGEIQVVKVQGINGLCQVTYFRADNPSQVVNSLFDEYGIDEHGYLGGFAIQFAVNQFFSEQGIADNS